jgi:hypothetical protein
MYLNLLPMAVSLMIFSIDTHGVWWADLLTLVGAFWSTPAAVIILVIITKWTLIGKMHPCTQVIGRWHCVRYWLVDRLMLGSTFRTTIRLLGSTPVNGAILRSLGAQVGKRCFLNDLTFGADVDMIDLGDDVFAGSQVVLIARSQLAVSTPGIFEEVVHCLRSR